MVSGYLAQFSQRQPHESMVHGRIASADHDRMARPHMRVRRKRRRRCKEGKTRHIEKKRNKYDSK